MSIIDTNPLVINPLADWENHVAPQVREALLKEKFDQKPDNGQVVALQVSSRIDVVTLLSAGSEKERDELIKARMLESFAELAKDLLTLNSNCKILGCLSLPSWLDAASINFELEKFLFVFPIIEKTTTERLVSLDMKSLKLDMSQL